MRQHSKENVSDTSSLYYKIQGGENVLEYSVIWKAYGYESSEI